MKIKLYFRKGADSKEICKTNSRKWVEFFEEDDCLVVEDDLREVTMVVTKAKKIKDNLLLKVENFIIEGS